VETSVWAALALLALQLSSSPLPINSAIRTQCISRATQPKVRELIWSWQIRPQFHKRSFLTAMRHALLLRCDHPYCDAPSLPRHGHPYCGTPTLPRRGTPRRYKHQKRRELLLFLSHLGRTNSIPSPYQGRFILGFRAKIRTYSGDGTAMVRPWYGAGGLDGHSGAGWEQSVKASHGGRGVATWRAASRYRRHIVPMGFTGDSWVEHKGTQRSASPYGREGTRKWGGAPTAPPLLGA